jgi:hypothetical protein
MGKVGQMDCTESSELQQKMEDRMPEATGVSLGQ